MSTNREVRSQRYARLHQGESAGYDPRVEVQRSSSRTRQALEAARQRAQALTYIRLPKRKLPPVAWMAYQLRALARKGGIAC